MKNFVLVLLAMAIIQVTVCLETFSIEEQELMKQLATQDIDQEIAELNLRIQHNQDQLARLQGGDQTAFDPIAAVGSVSQTQMTLAIIEVKLWLNKLHKQLADAEEERQEILSSLDFGTAGAN